MYLGPGILSLLTNFCDTKSCNTRVLDRATNFILNLLLYHHWNMIWKVANSNILPFHHSVSIKVSFSHKGTNQYQKYCIMTQTVIALTNSIHCEDEKNLMRWQNKIIVAIFNINEHNFNFNPCLNWIIIPKLKQKELYTPLVMVLVQ